MAESMCIEVDGKSSHSNLSSPFDITATATNDLNSSDSLGRQHRPVTLPVSQETTHSSKASTTAGANMAQSGEAEELLNSAFQELEKERTRRMELEAKLRTLQESSLAASLSPAPTSPRRRPPTSQQRRQQQEDDESPRDSIHSKQYDKLQQELVGYRQIVDAMTQEKPAIAAAVRATHERQLAVRTGRPRKNHCPTLPLHVVQILEVMPWKAQEHAFGTEEIYEWQVYNLQQRQWCADRKHFPSLFRALTTLASTGSAVHEQNLAFESSSSSSSGSPQRSGKGHSMLMFLAGCERMGSSSRSSSGSGSSASLTVPPEKSVLTDGDLTHVINITNGVSLPDDGGTWQWVGCWRIEKRVIVYAGSGREGMDNKGHRQTALDCDEEGWSYAMDAIDYLRDNPEELCHEHPGMVQDKVTLEKATFLSGNHVVRHMVPLRRVRRRKWTRRRVLVDYPFASEQSRHFLRLLAQNASLAVAANRISDQLVETKMKLADTQLKTQQNETESRQKIQQLNQEIIFREKRIHKLKHKRALEKMKQGTPPTKWSTVPKETTKPARLSARREMYDGCAESPKETLKPQVFQSLISSWIVPSSAGQKKVDSGGEEGSGGSVADDSSFSSSEQPPVDAIADDSIDTCASRRHSVSSTGTEKSSFDWKKLGREAMEKIKHRQASAVKMPLVWMNPATTERNSHRDDVSCSSRSASPSEFLQPEVSASIE